MVGMRSTVQAAEMRVLRLIRGVTLRDKLRNTDIRSELGIKGILRYVEEMQLRWFGHVKKNAGWTFTMHAASLAPKQHKTSWSTTQVLD